MNVIDHRVERMIRCWILLEAAHHEDQEDSEEEVPLTEVVLMPTGYEIRGLPKAS